MSERKYNHVAVLMGGWSAEREVSLSSGRACAAALALQGYRVSEIDVDRRIVETLRDLAPDACFNALHGPFGEDGKIQAILEFLEIPYTHSGVLASALAMHKERAKTVAAAAAVPVAQSCAISIADLARGHAPLARPYVLKPLDEGSSVGVFIVEEGAEFDPAVIVDDAELANRNWMVERFIPGRELTCSVMRDTPLGVTEIVPAEGLEFYDYEAKYAEGGSKHILPAQLLPDLYRSIERLSLAAHKAIGCRGVSRSDFRFAERADGSHELIWLEVNTQPGMTATSLVPEQAAAAGWSMSEFVSWLVEDAGCDR